MERAVVVFTKIMLALMTLVLVVVSVLHFTGRIDVEEWAKRMEGKADSPTNSVSVGPDGGTFSFDDDVVIVVPKGAVSEESTLRYGEVKALGKGDEGPFKGLRSSATSFDVSLLQGGKAVQPKKPLALRLPLQGEFAGKGLPLAYTVLPGGETSYALLPAKRQKQSLTVSLPHLSPKVLTYLSDDALLGLFREDKAIEDRDTCKQEIEVGGTKVRMGQKKGWSLADDSAIFACLVAGDGTANVGIVNRIDYMLSVAATSDLRIAASRGDAQTELIKMINNRLFPNKKVKALLASGDKLVGEVKPGNLPATIELTADPSTFFSEIAYNTVGLLVGILTGKGTHGLAEDIEKVFTYEEVTTCLQSAAGRMGDSPGPGDIAHMMYDCFLPIASATAKVFDIEWWKAGWVIDALKTGYETIVRSVNGIKLTFNNTMRVPVEADYQLDGYTGEWWVHGSMLTINADGTGTQESNAGPCEDDLSLEVGMCTGHSNLKVRRINGGIRVTRMDDMWFTTADGTRYVPWYVRENGLFNTEKEGYSSDLIDYRPGALKSSRGKADDFGNPYLCRSYTASTICDKQPE